MNDVNLPAVLDQTTPALTALTDALGVPRSVLASDQEIETAWNNLPSVLKKVPPALRTESLARMCVAVSCGLFDSALNYVWNASVTELREKIKRFGLNAVQQVASDPEFDEKKLNDLKDAELLGLSLKLNLITEDGYFFLDQCRDIRNNFSAAHPAVGSIDEHEFISFVNRCAKYALGDEHNPVGIDIQAFVAALKATRFTNDQTSEWVQRLNKTHDAQREFLVGTLHGMYSDPASGEETRLNAIDIVSHFSETLSPAAKSTLIDRHQDYLAKGDTERHKASQQFFDRLGLLVLLTEAERHAYISGACARLFSVHQAFDNFHNEPPFAERLDRISQQGAIPETAQSEFVTTVVTCAVGNPYGISHAAYPHYERMIRGFSPGENAVMLQLPGSSTVVGQRIKAHRRCREAFKAIIKLIEPSSVPTKVKADYDQWVK